MGFHEVNLSDSIAYGARGGPGFKTQIQTLDSGQENRIERWANPRRVYDIAYGIQDHADVASILEFYIARKGAAFGFRFKDFHDCTTATTHVDETIGGTAPANDDEQLGTGDGTTTQFQLIKRYVSGGIIRTRTITKPRSGTVLIAINGVAKTEGVDFTVNTTSGLVTFGTAPAFGALVTWGGYFDVPVRFSEEADTMLQAQITGPADAEISSLKLVELVDEVLNEEEYDYGGGKTMAISANTSITCLDGRALEITASSPGLKLILPDTTNLPNGGPYFFIINGGANSFDVYYHGGATLVFTCVAGQFSTLALIDGVWYEGH